MVMNSASMMMMLFIWSQNMRIELNQKDLECAGMDSCVTGRLNAIAVM